MRFEIENDQAEVHISVAPPERERGYATHALRLGCETLRDQIRRVVGHIKADNLGSIRAFEKAGFVHEGQVTVAGQPAERMVLELIVDIGGPVGVLFAVEAGPETGMGHLARSSALANALRLSHVPCVFLTGSHPSVVEKIRAAGASTVRNDAQDLDADPRTLARVAREHRCAAIVIDSYHVGDTTLAGLRELGFVVTVIDDLAREPFSCHLVVNGGPEAPALHYRSSASDTIFLLGPEYALLRSEFWNPPPREPRSSVEQVLVSLGAGAPAELIASVLSSLEAVDRDFEITLVRGPFTADRGGRAPSTQGSRHPVRVITDPPSVCDPMRSADLAVCGGGQTLLELAAVGTPAIAVQLADNQAGSIRAMVRSGAARLAGIWDDPALGVSISMTVHELCERIELRTALGVAGQRLVDGGGAVRVAGVLLQLLAAQPKLGRAWA